MWNCNPKRNARSRNQSFTFLLEHASAKHFCHSKDNQVPIDPDHRQRSKQNRCLGNRFSLEKRGNPRLTFEKLQKAMRMSRTPREGGGHEEGGRSSVIHSTVNVGAIPNGKTTINMGVKEYLLQSGSRRPHSQKGGRRTFSENFFKTEAPKEEAMVGMFLPSHRFWSTKSKSVKKCKT
jgi:hypothetical protein